MELHDNCDCHNSRLSGSLYIVECVEEGRVFCKIGSTFDMDARLRLLRHCNKNIVMTLVFELWFPLKQEAMQIEKDLCQRLKSLAVRGREWLNIRPHELVAHVIEQVIA